MADTNINAYFAEVDDAQLAVDQAQANLDAKKAALDVKKKEVDFVDPTAEVTVDTSADDTSSSDISSISTSPKKK